MATGSSVHLCRMRERVLAVAGVVLVGVALSGLGWWSAKGLTGYRLDLDVYRIGASVWLDGGPLYGELPALRGGGHLPFTYPPIAAVLLAPFALVPFGVASAAMVVLTVAALRILLPSIVVPFAGIARYGASDYDVRACAPSFGGRRFWTCC